MIFAGYNGSGAMVMCELDAGRFEIPSGSDVKEIKIMLWENLAKLVPLAPALAKEVK